MAAIGFSAYESCKLQDAESRFLLSLCLPQSLRALVLTIIFSLLEFALEFSLESYRYNIVAFKILRTNSNNYRNVCVTS
jgi:hypothetical protein